MSNSSPPRGIATASSRSTRLDTAACPATSSRSEPLRGTAGPPPAAGDEEQEDGAIVASEGGLACSPPPRCGPENRIASPTEQQDASPAIGRNVSWPDALIPPRARS